MIYLWIFWISLLIYFIVLGLAKVFKWKKIKSHVEKHAFPFFLVMLFLAIMAIITNDPISIGQYTLPMEVQWLGSLLAAGFGLWKYYLNPLKSKVYEVDREVGEVKTTVKKVEKDMDKLLDKLFHE